MLSVSQLAKKYGVSRATVLYYERKGLLTAKHRGENGYRWYSKEEEQTFKLIMQYRALGLPVSQLHNLVNRAEHISQERILREQFDALEAEITQLKQQQKDIVNLLEQPELLNTHTIDKTKWVDIMQAAGLNQEDRKHWHRVFEQRQPEEHQKFLESLGIPQDEINHIRNF